MEPVTLVPKTQEQESPLLAGESKLSAPARNATRWLLLVGAIALVCFIAARDIRWGEFEYHVDEAQHAVTGLFMADMFRDMPVRHPVEYAYRYYAQYPAVALFHWPPLFYLFEGMSFLLLGASAVSARLTVMLFSVLLLWQWFRMVEEWQDSYTAAIATAVLGLLPEMLIFEKTVMLEVPSLALCVAAIRYWGRYLDEERKSDLYAFGLWLTAALLCKQTSVFLLVFCALSLTATRKWKLLFRREVLVVAGVVAVLAGPFLLVMAVLQGNAMAHDLNSHRMTGVAQLTFYLRTLPRTFTTFMLVLSGLGIVVARRWMNDRHAILMICWILAGYLTFSFFGQREARFAIYWFPPLVYFAVGVMTRFFSVPKLRLAMRVCAALLVGVLSISAWSQNRPSIAGYQSVARYIVQHYPSGIVLFDGHVPGDFVFYMRSLDSQRRFLVLRKVLYANDIRIGGDTEQLVHSDSDLDEAFRQYGIRLVVVSEDSSELLPAQHMLRNYLQSPQFQLLGRFPIQSSDPDWKDSALLLYENKQWEPPVAKELRIRMLTLPHDIIVPLDRFGSVQR